MPDIWTTYEAAVAVLQLRGRYLLNATFYAHDHPDWRPNVDWWELNAENLSELQQLRENPPRGRGRPKGIGRRFANAEDFRQAVITDLRHLRENSRDDTQIELARLWYQNDNDPTANLDSLVTEIKRYCRRYYLPWVRLKAEALRR